MEGMVKNNIESNFWNKKRVLVTGHTGFKGGWLSLWLQTLGSQVLGISNEVKKFPSFFEIANVANGMEHKLCDVCDFDLLNKIIKEFKPEVIFHLAAQPLVLYSYENPRQTFFTNVLGTVNILEAVRSIDSVRAFINVTTDKVYSNCGGISSYNELDELGGIDPYSSSKSCSEFVVNAYRESFFKNAGPAIASVRAGNVIGGGDWAADRLIPDILYALINNINIEIRNPESIRPWQHVLEPLSGYLMLAEKLYEDGNLYSEAWNFGPFSKDEKNVGWIVDKMCEKWGVSTRWALQSGLRPTESKILKLDINKSLNKLKWSPKWSLEEAIEHVVEWHKYWINSQNMNKYSVKQIEMYQRLV